MIEKDITDVVEVQEGPGSILRRAREARGLDATAVAAMLHISESKLRALETDNFDALPEPVFVRGYLKNYARLLEEPVAPILEAYSVYDPVIDIEAQPPLDSHVAVEVSSDHGAIKIVSIIIVAALITLPFIWWWDYLELAAQKIVGSDSPKIEQEALQHDVSESESKLTGFIPPPPPGSSDIKPEAEQKIIEEVKEEVTTALDIKPKIAPIEKAIEEVKEEVAAISKEEMVKIPSLPKMDEMAKPIIEAEPEKIVKPVIKSVIRPMPKPEPVEKPAVVAVTKAPTPAPAPAPEPPKPVASVKGVEFNFVEASWVKVRNSKNQVIMQGEFKKGAAKKLTGEMSYKVVLGNAPGVRIKIDGKSASIDKFSSGGVARFTIKGGKIENP